MAYRKSSWRKLKASEVLPIWTPAHSAISTDVYKSVLSRIGITDFSSYWHKMQGAIVLSVIVSACIGASMYGVKGFFLGGLLGVGAPAVAIFMAVVLVLAAIFLGIFLASWLAIYYIACWLLGS